LEDGELKMDIIGTDGERDDEEIDEERKAKYFCPRNEVELKV